MTTATATRERVRPAEGTSAAEADGVPLPECRRCQRRAGLSGGLCAFCLAKEPSPFGVLPATEKQATELDRALTVLREQAVRDGWVGKKPDTRALSPGKTG
jgi:hypothetical protein